MVFGNSVMLRGIRHNATLCARKFSTSEHLGFKFKLTDELMKKYEEQQRAKKKPPPELALTTKESPLLMGRVSHDRYNQVVKIGVPKHRLNEYYLLFVKEKDDVQALDANNISKPGDWVLIRRDPNPMDEKVPFVIERVVYSYGNYIDPLTGKRSFGVYYDEDMERLEKIKLEV